MKEQDSNSRRNNHLIGLIEKAGKRIPDPVIIFIWFVAITFVLTAFIGGLTFETLGAGGEYTSHTIKNMTETEHVIWFFDNAILNNWLGFGNGILGVILIVMLGVGVAENSGLFNAIIKKLGTHLNDKYLTPALIFLGILSSIATDAGYLILIPLAGLLYAGLGKNPLNFLSTEKVLEPCFILKRGFSQILE